MSRAPVVNPPGRRALRWALWLATGIAFGVLAGFAAGLSRPRIDPAPTQSRPSPAPDGTAEESAR